MKKHTIPAGRDSKSEMYNLIEVVIRNVLAEKEYQTRRQVESLINKSANEVKQEIAMLETRIASVEATMVAVKCQVAETQKNLFEKTIDLHQEIQRIEKDYITAHDGMKHRTVAFAEDLQALHKENAGQVNRALAELKDEAKKSALSLGEDLRHQNREIGRIREYVDTL
jgi:effector-binding domain-containing protein